MQTFKSKLVIQCPSSGTKRSATPRQRPQALPSPAPQRPGRFALSQDPPAKPSQGPSAASVLLLWLLLLQEGHSVAI